MEQNSSSNPRGTDEEGGGALPLLTPRSAAVPPRVGRDLAYRLVYSRLFPAIASLDSADSANQSSSAAACPRLYKSERSRLSEHTFLSSGTRNAVAPGVRERNFHPGAEFGHGKRLFVTVFAPL